MSLTCSPQINLQARGQNSTQGVVDGGYGGGQQLICLDTYSTGRRWG